MSEEVSFTQWCPECKLKQNKKGDGRCPGCFFKVNPPEAAYE